MISILVVEDDEDVRALLEEMLREFGYQSRLVADTAAAFAALEAGGVDVILTDLNLPQESGLSFVNRARFNGHTQPVIVLTGHGSKEAAIGALRLGAVDFLEKPFEKSDLKDALAAVANRPMLHAPSSTSASSGSQFAICRSQLETLKTTPSSSAALESYGTAVANFLAACEREERNAAASAARTSVRLVRLLIRINKPQAAATALSTAEALSLTTERALHDSSFDPKDDLDAIERKLSEIERRIKLRA